MEKAAGSAPSRNATSAETRRCPALPAAQRHKAAKTTPPSQRPPATGLGPPALGLRPSLCTKGRTPKASALSSFPTAGGKTAAWFYPTYAADAACYFSRRACRPRKSRRRYGGRRYAAVGHTTPFERTANAVGPCRCPSVWYYAGAGEGQACSLQRRKPPTKGNPEARRPTRLQSRAPKEQNSQPKAEKSLPETLTLRQTFCLKPP